MVAKFIRIGKKVINQTRVIGIIKKIFQLRSRGFSQSEVAEKFEVERSFISRLEGLGEVRRGGTIALVGFPVDNKEELEAVAREEGIDFVLLMTEEERWAFIKEKDGLTLFNKLMEIISELKQYQHIIFFGSDMRIELVNTLLDGKVIGIEIGESPIREDKFVDPEELREVIRMIKGEEEGTG